MEWMTVSELIKARKWPSHFLNPENIWNGKDDGKEMISCIEDLEKITDEQIHMLGRMGRLPDDTPQADLTAIKSLNVHQKAYLGDLQARVDKIKNLHDAICKELTEKKRTDLIDRLTWEYCNRAANRYDCITEGMDDSSPSAAHKAAMKKILAYAVEELSDTSDLDIRVETESWCSENGLAEEFGKITDDLFSTIQTEFDRMREEYGPDRKTAKWIIENELRRAGIAA